MHRLPQGGPSFSQSFNAANNQLSSGGYTYDAAGNMTYDGFHHYSYDAEGRRVQTDAGSTAIYLYDALNNLVSGHAQGQPESDSLYDLQGRQTSAWSTQTTMSEAHIFADGRQIGVSSGYV